MKIAPAAAAVAGVAPVLKLVIALTFVIGLSAHSHGQDPAVEIRDQADRIVAQLKTTWSRNKATISALKDRERAERDAQQHFVRQLGAPIVQPCTEQEKSTTERTIVLKLNGIRSAFNTALSSEEERLKTLQREYSMATSSGAAYQTQISLYDKLAWSRARLQMILYLDSILSEDVIASMSAIETNCLNRKILASKQVPFQDVEKLLREAASQGESTETEMLSRSDFYRQSLDTVMRMP